MSDSDSKSTDIDAPDAVIRASIQDFDKAISEGRARDAQNSALNFLAQVNASAGKKPSQGLLLRQEATRYENKGDWKGAEHLYRQTLALAEAQNQVGNIFMAHQNLRRLYAFLDQDHDALKESRLAIALARRSQSGPTISALLIEELMAQAECALRLDNVPVAFEVITEMLQIAESKPIYTLPKGRGLVILARCELAMDKVAEAEANLGVAWSILSPLTPASILAAAQLGLANWWRVTAQLCAMRGDMQGEVKALRESVSRHRLVAKIPQLDGPYKYEWLSSALRNLGRALNEAGQIALAREAIAESNRIWQAIGLPTLDTLY